MPLIKCYHIEGNFGGCKIWQLSYKNTFGDFGEFECNVILNKVFWRKKLWQINEICQCFHPTKFPLYGMYKNATHDSTVSAYSVSNNN